MISTRRAGRLATIDGAPYPIEQTIRNNLQDLCTVMGGGDNVTREAVEAHGLEWEDWVEFVLEMHDHQRYVQDCIAWEVAAIEASTGEKVELAKLEEGRLGLLRLKPDDAAASGSTPTSS